MERRCRVCTLKEDDKSFRNLFGNRINFAEKLFYVASISVFEITELQPALICNRCADDLGRAYRIKKLAIESDLYFKSIESSDDIQILAEVIDSHELIKQEQEYNLKDEKSLKDEDSEHDYDSNDIKIEFLDEYADETPQYVVQYEIEPLEKPKKQAKTRPTPRGSYRPRGTKELIYCPHEGCIRTFRKPSELTYHMQTHSDERKYACDQCGIMFKVKGYLNKHKQTHLNIRVICDHCGKSFSNKISLRNHIKRTHLKIVSTVCHLCGKGLSCKQLIKTHMLYSHGGEKNFKCNICDKAFYTKIKLKQHIDALHGERPWVCEICAKTFSKRYKLGEHMKQVHKIALNAVKRFDCTLCGASFDRNKLLQTHLKDMHQVIFEGSIIE